jgi:ferredoxin
MSGQGPKKPIKSPSPEELSMADISTKWKENTPGKMFVDETCIACDACVLAAPNNFKMHEEDGHAYVAKQPENPDEESACKEAMEGCPVEAIGDFGEKG